MRSRRAFIRVETTQQGLDIWLGLELTMHCPNPEELLRWLRETVHNGDPLCVALDLEISVKNTWPGTHYFIEVGREKHPITFQIYGDGA
jgi:hypothetical protein